MRTVQCLLLNGIVVMFMAMALTLPVVENTDSSTAEANSTIEADYAMSLNDTPKDLYVVKAVVYEVGILTDADSNATSNSSSESQEQERVDLTFYDAHTNESHIDLGNIPLPVQTNVSGQVLTGIAPVNVGAFSSPAELIDTLPLTGSIVNITHSDTAYYQLTKSNGSRSAEHAELMPLSNITQLFDEPTIKPER